MDLMIIKIQPEKVSEINGPIFLILEALKVGIKDIETNQATDGKTSV